MCTHICTVHVLKNHDHIQGRKSDIRVIPKKQELRAILVYGASVEPYFSHCQAILAPSMTQHAQLFCRFLLPKVEPKEWLDCISSLINLVFHLRSYVCFRQQFNACTKQARNKSSVASHRLATHMWLRATSSLLTYAATGSQAHGEFASTPTRKCCAVIIKPR